MYAINTEEKSKKRISENEMKKQKSLKIRPEQLKNKLRVIQQEESTKIRGLHQRSEDDTVIYKMNSCESNTNKNQAKWKRV